MMLLFDFSKVEGTLFKICAVQKIRRWDGAASCGKKFECC